MKKDNSVMMEIIALVIGILIIATIVVMFVISSHKVTDLEKIKLEDVSDTYMTYMENVENSESKEIDKYIIYALEYNYYEKGEEKVSIDDVRKTIENTFNKKVNEEDISKIGITPDMLNKNITYDFESQKFSLNITKKSLPDIAATEIVKYELKEISKKKKNTYVVKYNKYIVKNPYEVLNYYMEKQKDTKEIDAYLKGNAPVSQIKKYINEDSMNYIVKNNKDKKEEEINGKIEEGIEVTYVVKNGKVLVDEIK